MFYNYLPSSVTGKEKVCDLQGIKRVFRFASFFLCPEIFWGLYWLLYFLTINVVSMHVSHLSVIYTTGLPVLGDNDCSRIRKPSGFVSSRSHFKLQLSKPRHEAYLLVDLGAETWTLGAFED